MILTGIIQLLELAVPAFWRMVLLALRTAMATAALIYVPAFAGTAMLVDFTILPWIQVYISVILGVSRANGVSAAIGDSRGFLPIGGRDRTLADHSLSFHLQYGDCSGVGAGQLSTGYGLIYMKALVLFCVVLPSIKVLAHTWTLCNAHVRFSCLVAFL